MINRVLGDHVHTAAVAKPVVRPAADADVQTIVDIVNEHARQGHLLPRNADNIRASLPNWLVAEVEGATSPVNAPREVRQREAEVAETWFKTITAETFG